MDVSKKTWNSLQISHHYNKFGTLVFSFPLTGTPFSSMSRKAVSRSGWMGWGYSSAFITAYINLVNSQPRYMKIMVHCCTALLATP
jgi:hypothetical protein